MANRNPCPVRRAASKSAGARIAYLDTWRSRGFSLIEILVVLVILGVAVAAVTLGIAGAGGGRQLERDAERLGALVSYACEQAELSGRDIGMSFSRSGYRFGRSNHAGWEL